MENFIYDPYGTVTVLNGNATAQMQDPVTGVAMDMYNWLYLHQGGRLDPVTGLYNFDHRVYGPGLGRWNEEDPIGMIAAMALAFLPKSTRI